VPHLIYIGAGVLMLVLVLVLYTHTYTHLPPFLPLFFPLPCPQWLIVVVMCVGGKVFVILREKKRKRKRLRVAEQKKIHENFFGLYLVL